MRAFMYVTVAMAQQSLKDDKVGDQRSTSLGDELNNNSLQTVVLAALGKVPVDVNQSDAAEGKAISLLVTQKNTAISNKKELASSLVLGNDSPVEGPQPSRFTTYQPIEGANCLTPQDVSRQPCETIPKLTILPSQNINDESIEDKAFSDVLRRSSECPTEDETLQKNEDIKCKALETRSYQSFVNTASPSPGNVSHPSAEDINNRATADINNGSTKDVNNRPTEDINNRPTEDINNRSTEDINNRPTEDINNRPTEDINNGSTEAVNNRTIEDINNRTTEYINNRATEDINNRATEDINNRATEDINNRATEDMTLQSTEYIRHQSTEDVHYQSTKKKNHQSIEDMNRLLTEDMNCRSTEDMNRLLTEDGDSLSIGDMATSQVVIHQPSNQSTRKHLDQQQQDSPKHVSSRGAVIADSLSSLSNHVLGVESVEGSVTASEEADSCYEEENNVHVMLSHHSSLVDIYSEEEMENIPESDSVNMSLVNVDHPDVVPYDDHIPVVASQPTLNLQSIHSDQFSNIVSSSDAKSSSHIQSSDSNKTEVSADSPDSSLFRCSWLRKVCDILDSKVGIIVIASLLRVFFRVLFYKTHSDKVFLLVRQVKRH